MSDAVHWLLEINIKEGERDTFKALKKEMVDVTQANEPGTLNYEWFISDDGKTCHMYERYADSAATMTHLASFGQNFAERFLAARPKARVPRIWALTGDSHLPPGVWLPAFGGGGLGRLR